MKTFGRTDTQELISVVLDEEGDPRLDTLAPNPRPEDWTPPELVPLVKLPKPESALQTFEPVLNWFSDRVERAWVAKDWDLAAEAATKRAAMPEMDYAVFWVMLCRAQWNGVTFEQHVWDVYNAMPDGQQKKELFYWMNNSKFRRTHPVLVGFATQMGVSAEQLDTMWEAALAAI